MKYTPQIIELADGTKCVALEDFRRECDEAREAIRALAEHGESEIQRITKERDEAMKESLEQARLLGISGERECRLIAERDEAKKKYDTLAVENMLEVNKLYNQREAAIDALMKIEEIFIDGDDTYEDWKSMGQIARTFLENKI
jgi:5-formyltetrahydrofolate cyclo-ligase